MAFRPVKARMTKGNTYCCSSCFGPWGAHSPAHGAGFTTAHEAQAANETFQGRTSPVSQRGFSAGVHPVLRGSCKSEGEGTPLSAMVAAQAQLGSGAAWIPPGCTGGGGPTRPQPFPTAILLPKSGIKLLNANMKLRSRNFVYCSTGDTAGGGGGGGVSLLQRCVQPSIKMHQFL